MSPCVTHSRGEKDVANSCPLKARRAMSGAWHKQVLAAMRILRNVPLTAGGATMPV